MTDPRRLVRPPPLDGVALTVQPAPDRSGSVAMTFVAPAGSAYDPERGRGTARMTLRAMTAAAGPWNHHDLGRRLDALGASLSAHLAPESAEVTIVGPSGLWREIAETLVAIVQRPRWDRSDIARIRRALEERALRERTVPAPRAEIELIRQVFPRGHPYHESGTPPPAEIRRIRPRDLIAFWERHYGADGALLVVTGAGRPETVRRAFARLLTGRRPGPAPPRPGRLDRTVADRRTVEIPMPERSQVELRVGGPSLPRSDAAYPALFLAEQILGGHPPLGRLFQRVREREGLAYHTDARLEAMRWAGYWVVSAGCAPANRLRALRLLTEEVERLASEDPPASELATLRESAIGEMPLLLETTEGAHELAVDAAYHGLEDDHWIVWPARLRAIRPREVRETAARGLSAARSVRVVAGDLTGRARPGGSR
ncbi:MAG: pitrilysin family protein [Thermoplasmata archaeon]